jgi:aminoglycoside 2'-N-acetyltransferase I
MQLEEWDGEASRHLVSRLRNAVYPPEVLAKIVWRDITSAAASRRILVTQDEEVVAAAGFLWRNVYLDGAPVLIGGLGGVMTAPELQGKGLGRIAVEAAMKALINDRQPAFGLLFCEDKNTGFYSRLGWKCFEGAVRVDQPTGRIVYRTMTVMVAPLDGQAPMRGNVDLCGLPW